MKKEIFINENMGETRIAIQEDSKLVEVYVENHENQRMVGNIYKGKVENVLPGMQAAFVDIGYELNAFLPFSEIENNEYIIPLAALVGAPLCDKYKKEAISVNHKSIKTMVSLSSKKNKIIFLTTNSGYGVGEKNKYCNENSPLKPISLYG